MNLLVHNLDTLRKIIRNLMRENRELKEKLKSAGIPYESADFFCNEEDNEQFDLDQGGRIQPRFITDDMAKDFFRMFWGRHDVYAKRGTNGGYFPQCENRWNVNTCPWQRGEKHNCKTCPNQRYASISTEILKNHLIGYREDGADAIGIYPLLPDGTCRLLVFDFDNHDSASEDNQNVKEEVDALRVICERNGLHPLVERSRSGKGAHVWLFFQKPIDASKARKFGYLLLDKGAMSVNLKSFSYYDRMFPAQDYSDNLGNLVALPLQGRALLKGNTAFVDEDWNAYPGQWKVLLENTPKLDEETVDAYIIKWQSELHGTMALSAKIDSDYKPMPWRRSNQLDNKDVDGRLHIVLADGIYIDTLNLTPHIANQFRNMAAFDNPEYYKNQRMGYSNFKNSRTIYLGEDISGYLKVPRGLLETILEQCNKANIEYEIENERELGRPIKATFNGDLHTQQQLAAEKLLTNEDGVLAAATAFGKTVVSAYLIGKRKVNTLILLQSKDLLEQWVDELNKFLDIDEELPEYFTKTGRRKKRDSVIGVLHGTKNTLTGIIDVAMVGSVYSKGKFIDEVNNYGMIIMDECHHAASNTAVAVLRKLNARFVYGVSATPIRSDNLEKMIFMLLGPIRHRYSAADRANEQGISHYFIPRYTRAVDKNGSKEDINRAYEIIASNERRNNQILEDVKYVLANRMTPVILTRTKEHAKYFYEQLKDIADNTFLYYGDNTDKDNREIRNTMKSVSEDETMLLIATGSKIGEGFDLPRLNTLFLAAPISFEGRLEQYVGRLNRNYPEKNAVYVFDYIDSHMRYFDKMFNKRLRTYKKIGYTMLSFEDITRRQDAFAKSAFVSQCDISEINAIYDSQNYINQFEQDIISAKKNVVISSPSINEKKIYRLLDIVKELQEKGVEILVYTKPADSYSYGDSSDIEKLIFELKEHGIEVVLDEEAECFAIIDELIVWHGGMNLLGKADGWDNLIRVEDNKIAEELMVRADDIDH